VYSKLLRIQNHENERSIDSLRRKEEGRNASFSREIRRLNESLEKRGPMEVSIEIKEYSQEKKNSNFETFESYSGDSTRKSAKKRRGREERNNIRAEKDKLKHKEDFGKRINEPELKKVQQILRKMTNQREETEETEIMNIEDQESLSKVLSFYH